MEQMLHELKSCLEEVTKSVEAYKAGAIENEKAHILPIDPRYISLLTSQANLLVAIANIEQFV